ncbi:hypothetical protein [Mycoplasmopsis primatum]|uniref:hypothetical protein n=1 Tax=Mycoplasmopsis primatum TaxID=55604 RepID=UPI00068BF8E2|nr:hypothetical protein [Mycoplasmopsis primatum]
MKTKKFILGASLIFGAFSPVMISAACYPSESKEEIDKVIDTVTVSVDKANEKLNKEVKITDIKHQNLNTKKYTLVDQNITIKGMDSIEYEFAIQNADKLKSKTKKITITGFKKTLEMEINHLIDQIKDETIKSNFKTKLSEYNTKLTKQKDEILNSVINDEKIKSAIGEKEIPNVKEAFNLGVKLLENIIAKIQKETLEKYTKGTKVVDGLSTVKDYLTVDKIKELISEKGGIADTALEIGKKIGKYAKSIFAVLKNDDKTKNIAKLDDLIKAVDNKFVGDKNVFENISNKLKEFDFSKLKDEGYVKTFEKLISVIDAEKKEAIKVLNSVGLEAAEITNVKDAIRPYYTVLQKALTDSVNLFIEGLRDLGLLLENLK